MFKGLISILFAAMLAWPALLVPGAAQADKLDDILSSGKFRCGVMLDIPPIGFRDENNNPVGYDVFMCKDLAEALGVELELVETPGPDRIPAVLSDRVDASVTGATNTLERAKAVGFSIPYQIWDFSIAVRKDDDSIQTFDDLKGKTVGAVRSTTPELYFLPIFKEWDDDDGDYIAYGTVADLYLALKQGKIDAFPGGTVEIAQVTLTPQGRDFKICCVTPFPQDWTGIMVKRSEYGLLNWINLFLWHQWKNGRINELYETWWGFPAPPMAWPGVHGY